MSVVIIAQVVADTIGAANVEAVTSGRAVPGDAQCWWCGGAVHFTGAEGSVSMSLLTPPKRFPGLHHRDERPGIGISLWSHTGCVESKMVTLDELETSPADGMAAPVQPEPPRLFVDGELRPGPHQWPPRP